MNTEISIESHLRVDDESHTAHMAVAGGRVAERIYENYLQNELHSLGIHCKRMNEFNDKEELEALAIAIKEVYFQDYKTAYDGNNNDNDITREKELIEPHL